MPDTEDKRIAPIALPANSFDLQELEKKLGAAVSVKDHEQHPERVAKAIADCAENKEVLANASRPVIPPGAVEVEREIVYAEGQEPVKGKALAFQGVDAESGTEASKMRYADRDGDMVGTTELVDAAEVTGTADVTIESAAREAIDTAGEGKAPAKDK
ncbi:MAG: hypothetical protein V4696_03690 [Pseudomonadota bacterium]